MLGSLGVPEIIFIVILALLIFGPKRLPEVGRTLGKGMAEFRRASSEIQRTINAELALEEDPRPVQYPRRVSLSEPEAEAPTPRTPPTGALARGSAIGDDEPDGPPVDVVDMAYVKPDPDADASAPAEGAASDRRPGDPPAAIEPS